MRTINLLLIWSGTVMSLVCAPALSHAQTGGASTDSGFQRWLADLDRRQEQPIFSTELGAIGLVREQPDSQTIALDENLMPIFNADQLQGDMKFGFQALLDFYEFFPICGGVDWQWGYFGINSMDAQTTLASVAVSPVFFNSIPVTPQPTSNLIYSSNLYSGEMNFRFRSRRRIRPVIGLRYFKLEEQYDAFNHGTGGFTRVGGFSNTNNSMFGGQFGGEADYWITRFTKVYVDGKYGAMQNDIEGAAQAADAMGNETTKYFSDSRFSSMVDAGVGLETEFAGPLSFRVGYRTLFASHVALGIDQNASVRLLSPGETVVFNSQHWHGLDMTAVFTY